MVNKYLKIMALSALFLIPSFTGDAQMFGGGQNTTQETQPVRTQDNSKASNKAAVGFGEEAEEDAEYEQMTPAEKREAEQRVLKAYQPKIINGELHINPFKIPNPTDGSKRGTAAFMPLPDKNGNIKKSEKESHIFIYYSNFSMTRSHAAGVGCRVRFNVLTTLDQRVMNLSVKLVWPNMTTNLSFDNINPNIETYLDYALFGDGCYKMDKIPNIIVNRCRAKGMSQEACAGKIRWLSKSAK